MPRKLPWASTKSSCPSPPPKRQRTTYAAPTPPITTSDKDDGSNDNDNDDIPTYMLPEDECYIMVEDELLSIAQTYTRSVHRAEYERLQSLAKSKNAIRISEIQRPVAGVTRMSREALAKRRTREDIVRGLPIVRGGDSSDEEGGNVWRGSSLGALMCNPVKQERDLSTRWKTMSNTKTGVDGGARRRLAAGLQVESVVKTEVPSMKRESTAKESTASDTSSSDDDDLDAPVRTSQIPSQLLPPKPLPQSTSTNRTIPSQSHPIHPSRSNTLPARFCSQPLPKLTRHPTAPSRPHSSQPAPSSSPPLPVPKKPPPDFDFGFGLAAAQRSRSYLGRSMAARKQAERKAASSPPPGGKRREGLLGRLFPVGE